MKLSDLRPAPSDAKTPEFKKFLTELKANCSEYLTVTDEKHILYRGRLGGIPIPLGGESTDGMPYGTRPILTNKDVNDRYNYRMFDYAVELRFGIERIRDKSTYCSAAKSRISGFASNSTNENYFFPMNGSKLLVGSKFEALDNLHSKFQNYMNNVMWNPEGDTSAPASRQVKTYPLEVMRKTFTQKDKEVLVGMLADDMTILEPNDVNLFEGNYDNEILVFGAPRYYIVNMTYVENYSMLLEWIKDWA